MKTLTKPSPQKCVPLSIFAYGHEDRIKQEEEDENFKENVTEMARNLKSGGVVVTDTVKVGHLKVHFAVRSPFKFTDNGDGTSTATFSGAFPAEIGMTVDENDVQSDDDPPEHVRDYYRGLIY